jgi:hypothetical protein
VVTDLGGNDISSRARRKRRRRIIAIIRRGRASPSTGHLRCRRCSAAVLLSCNDAGWPWTGHKAARKPRSSNPPALNRSKRASCIVDGHLQPAAFRGRLCDPCDPAVDASHAHHAQRCIEMGGLHRRGDERAHLFVAQAWFRAGGSDQAPIKQTSTSLWVLRSPLWPNEVNPKTARSKRRAPGGSEARSPRVRIVVTSADHVELRRSATNARPATKNVAGSSHRCRRSGKPGKLLVALPGPARVCRGQPGPLRKAG